MIFIYLNDLIIAFYKLFICNFRFSKNLDSNEICLYTTHIPKKFSKLKPPSCLVKWDTRKWCPDLMVQVPKMSISALATRLVYSQSMMLLLSIKVCKHSHRFFCILQCTLPSSKTFSDNVKSAMNNSKALFWWCVRVGLISPGWPRTPHKPEIPEKPLN